MASTGEWKLVQRRKSASTNAPAMETTEKVLTKPYIPYFNKKSYAQVVSSHMTGSETGSISSSSTNSSKPTSRPTTPPFSTTAPTYYTSPYSPTALRFPPSSAYQEWRGRCFRCLKLGHSASMCCNQLKCGRCWSDGYGITKCNNSKLNPEAKPFFPTGQVIAATQPIKNNPVTTRATQSSSPRPPFNPPKTILEQPKNAPNQKHDKKVEPSFIDLLTEPPHPLPEGRPESMMCFIERDAAFYGEVEKLKHAVIIYGPQGLSLPPSQAVEIAVNTGLVRPEEIRVASLAKKRTLIHLLRGLKVDTFIRALPLSLWDKGFSIQPWSQTEETEVVMPRFKLLLDLVDFPLHLWREKYVSKAVAGIGVFLGSVPSDQDTDRSYWRVAVATNDLGRVPKKLTIFVGGIKHNILVQPVTWKAGPIYAPSDFSPPAMRYSKTAPAQPPLKIVPSIEEPLHRPVSRNRADSDDMIHCSKRVLMDICKNLDSIPPELQELFAGQKHHSEVPIHVLREVAQATVDHVSTRATQQNSAFTPNTTQAGHMHPISPDLTSLFQEYHPENKSCPEVQMATDPASVEPVTELEAENQTKVSERRKDKHIAEPEFGKSSSAVCEAGPAIIFQAQKETKTGQSSHQRPQKTTDKRKEGGPTRIIPKSTSSHMRFRDSLGKGKSRPKLDESKRKDEAGQKKVDMGTKERFRYTHQPHTIQRQATPRVEKAKKGKQQEVRGDTSKLIDVPVKLAMDPTPGLNSGPSKNTPLKRKPPSNLTRGADLIKRQAEDKSASKIKEQASVHLDPAGYFQVQIDQELGESIGKGCGIDTSEVFDTLQADNIIRQIEVEMMQSGELQEDPVEHNWDEQEGDEQARFDLDPDDERYMEEDV